MKVRPFLRHERGLGVRRVAFLATVVWSYINSRGYVFSKNARGAACRFLYLCGGRGETWIRLACFLVSYRPLAHTLASLDRRQNLSTHTTPPPQF